MAREVPAGGSDPQSLNLTGSVLALSGLALTAGTIHLVAALQHLDVGWALPSFFAVIGVAQWVVSWRLYRTPDDRPLLAAAAAGSLVIVVLWVWSRTIGLSFGPEQGTGLIGVSDTVATLQELTFAGVALAILRAPERSGRRLAWFASPMGLRVTFAVLSAVLFIAAVGGHKH